MNTKPTLTRALAIAGTLLVWLPILAPVFFSAVALVARRVLRFDYLMPAELFPAALAGGCLLIWAALRAHAHRSVIAWGLAVAAGLLIGGQALAIVTGLASGEVEPIGWQWTLVLASLVGYSLAVMIAGVGGLLLLRDLFAAPGRLAEGR
jgi:hypothetical protein